MFTHALLERVPDCRADHFLPDFADVPHGSRSPFCVTSTEFVKCYGSTPKRRHLLKGLLAYRARLRALGISGWQWLDGSFVGKVEDRLGREPNDIDVVTFYEADRTPEDLLEFVQQADPTIANNTAVREQHGLDTYLIGFRTLEPFVLIRVACYWHGMWSRSKEGVVPAMKGYLVLMLDASDADDLEALQQLDLMEMLS